MLTDIHAHMDFLSKEKLKEIQNDKRIKAVVTNSVNMASCRKNLEISLNYPKIKFAAGLYPEDTLKSSDIGEFEKFVSENRKKISAIGEIGLDLHETAENFELQKEVFVKQLKLAQKLNLPVIIHTRKAEKEVLEILEKFPNLKVVLHCFTGNFKLVKEGFELGCYFSIPTNVVKSEHFQKLLSIVPKEKILTETDSPYLSPHKSKKNEPAFIAESIRKISEIWELSEEETEKIIEKNFERILGKIVKK